MKTCPLSVPWGMARMETKQYMGCYATPEVALCDIRKVSPAVDVGNQRYSVTMLGRANLARL